MKSIICTSLACLALVGCVAPHRSVERLLVEGDTNAVYIPLDVDLVLTLQDEKVKTVPGRSPDAPVIELVHILAEAVESEINSGTARSLLSCGEDLPLDVTWLPTYSIPEPYKTLVCRPNGIEGDDLKCINKRILRYVRSRFQWHTALYAMASLSEPDVRKRRWRRLSLRERIRLRYPDVPDSWLWQLDNGTTNTCPEDQFAVIDGGVAWVFFCDTPGGYVRFYRRDAQEYDPKLRAIFDNARSEAEKSAKVIVENKGIRGQPGAGNFYIIELLRLLKDQGIDWRPPSWLNPGMCCD